MAEILRYGVKLYPINQSINQPFHGNTSCETKWKDLDSKKLNKAVARENFMLLNLDDALPKVAGANYFLLLKGK